VSRLLNKFMEVFGPAGEAEGDDVLYEGRSRFHHITIREEGDRRTMYFGPDGDEAETSINMANPEAATFEYPGMMLAALPLHPEGRRVVMIGLGGGYLPGIFRRHLPQYELTVVEVDLLVAELAQTYFGFSAGGSVNLVIGDGRDFLERQPEGSLDQIWLDAFSGDYVPPQLSGYDFLKMCRTRLTPGGLVVQNLHQSRPHTFQNQLKTTQAALGDFLAFDGIRCGNAIVVSGRDNQILDQSPKKSLLESAAKRFGRRVGPYDLVEEMRKMKNFQVDPEAVILS